MKACYILVLILNELKFENVLLVLDPFFLSPASQVNKNSLWDFSFSFYSSVIWVARVTHFLQKCRTQGPYQSYIVSYTFVEKGHSYWGRRVKIMVGCSIVHCIVQEIIHSFISRKIIHPCLWSRSTAPLNITLPISL